MKKLIFLLIFLLVSSNLFASTVDLSVVSKIESSNNPKAYNKNSQAIGLFQITPICLKEYNVFHPQKTFNKQDLFNPKINTIIAKWYLNKRIPQMLSYYKKPVTIENILICYNAGISFTKSYKLPKETQNYIKKYKKLVKEKSTNSCRFCTEK